MIRPINMFKHFEKHLLIRIHKEPSHEKNPNSKQKYRQMWKDSRVDWAVITVHRLNCNILKQANNNNVSNKKDITELHTMASKNLSSHNIKCMPNVITGYTRRDTYGG